MVDHVRPDVICFLGDLMDEGNTSNELNFKEYYERFGSIFPTHPTAKTIYIPGDNDIGGEAGEEVKESVVRRFRQYFSEKPAWIVNDNVTIYNINKITHERPLHDPRMVDDTGVDVSDRYIRIFLSHMPVLSAASTFTYEVSVGNDYVRNSTDVPLLCCRRFVIRVNFLLRGTVKCWKFDLSNRGIN